jgi:hypothetical protein
VVVGGMIIILTESRLAAGHDYGCLTLSAIGNGKLVHPRSRILLTKKLHGVKVGRRGRPLNVIISSTHCRARRREGHRLQL